MYTSAPRRTSSAVPASRSGFVSSAYSALIPSRPGRPAWMAPCRSQPMIVPTSGVAQDPGRRDARGADPGQHDLDVLGLLPDDLERVHEGGVDDDRRAVLVVVEDRDVEGRAQAVLDLEAARRGDVLQVDRAVAGRDRGHGRHDLVGVGRREADGPAVDAAELLQQHRLALHHGHRRFRADVAEAEHRGPVGDDGDRVALDRQAPRLLRVVRDRLRDARDAGRVGHREVVARGQRRLQRDLDLAADVEQERPVGDVLDLDALDLVGGGGDRLDVVGVPGEDGHVADGEARLRADEVDRAERGARVRDHARQLGERAGAVLQAHPQRRAEGGGKVAAHAADSRMRASWRNESRRSTTAAQRRPSAIAQTISDWPRRASPAAKTPSTLVS